MYFKNTLMSVSIAVALSAAGLASAGENPGQRKDALDVAAQSVETETQAVADSVASKADDIRIHATLETRLAESDQLSALAIDTDVRDGIVTLEGDVETDAQRELATEMARSIRGVSEVDNRLAVTSVDPSITEKIAANATDAAITTAVKTRLLASDNTSGLAIDVDTDDHVVTLTGEVDSPTERELAGLIAANTSGVEHVINELGVQHRYQ